MNLIIIFSVTETDAITVDSTTARKPIYTREGLTTNTYDKGSVVLNMMRYYVGDEKFRRAMNIYITEQPAQTCCYKEPA